jgi:hypothetical protein
MNANVVICETILLECQTILNVIRPPTSPQDWPLFVSEDRQLLERLTRQVVELTKLVGLMVGKA